MYFVRLCTISDFNQLILVAAKADFHRMFNAGVPVGLRSGINEVVMVYMGHPVKLAAADNGLFIYRICQIFIIGVSFCNPSNQLEWSEGIVPLTGKFPDNLPLLAFYNFFY